MKRKIVPAALLAGLLLGPAAARAQLLLGQYEDEAPLATWNTLGAASAPSLALGGTQFARARDVSSALANPALLAGLPGFSVSLSASYGSASLFRYALVNTGVVTSSSNLSVGVVGLDHGGAAVRAGAWAFGLAVSLIPLVFLLNELTHRFGIARGGLYPGLALPMPRFSYLFVAAVLAAVAVPFSPGFFAVATLAFGGAASDAVLFLLPIGLSWVLWSWAGVNLLDGIVWGAARDDLFYRDLDRRTAALLGGGLAGLGVFGIGLVEAAL
jgi:hypothetical protein